MPQSKMRSLLSASFDAISFIERPQLPVTAGDEQMLIKCSVLGDNLGYLMAMYPAHFRLDFITLDNTLGRRLTPVTDKEKESFIIRFRFSTDLNEIFSRQLVVDSMLFYAQQLYLPLFSEQQYAKLSAEQFANLINKAQVFSFSYPSLDN